MWRRSSRGPRAAPAPIAATRTPNPSPPPRRSCARTTSSALVAPADTAARNKACGAPAGAAGSGRDQRRRQHQFHPFVRVLRQVGPAPGRARCYPGRLHLPALRAVGVAPGAQAVTAQQEGITWRTTASPQAAGGADQTAATMAQATSSGRPTGSRCVPSRRTGAVPSSSGVTSAAVTVVSWAARTTAVGAAGRRASRAGVVLRRDGHRLAAPPDVCGVVAAGAGVRALRRRHHGRQRRTRHPAPVVAATPSPKTRCATNPRRCVLSG